jgi:AraC-like DNA-binding protein
LGKLVGAEAPATLGIELFEKSKVAVTRVTWDERPEGRYAQMQREDAFLVCLELRDLPVHPYWVDGKTTDIPEIRSGQFTLLDLRLAHASELRDAIDCLATYVPHAALKAFADEHETPVVDALDIQPAVAIDDPVVLALGAALLPALNRPEEANRLFLDHVAMAFIAHMTAAYGDKASKPQRFPRGGLAPWQERRAKDAMLASIDSNVALAELAALCGLSRSHFARAFKRSTGLPPHRWLLTQRVRYAKDLLLRSTLTLDEISQACGFADQAHFSRVFAGFAGAPPGSWRRIRRT